MTREIYLDACPSPPLRLALGDHRLYHQPQTRNAV